MIAPAAPGSGWDQLAHTLREAIADVDGTTVVRITNVPGGSGALGLAKFVAEPVESDILVAGLTMLDAMLLKRTPDGLDRTIPLARLAAEYFAVVVPANSTIQSLAELRTAFLAEPSKVAWAGGHTGGLDHAAAALFAVTAGVAPLALNYVSFVTTGDAVAATVEGRVTAAFLSTVEIEPALKDEKLRVLAVAAPTRLPGLDAPTLREEGLDLDFANWRGVFARADRPTAEREALERLIAAVVRSPRWKALVERRGWQEAYLPNGAFAEFARAEKARLKTALRSIGLLKTGSE